MTCHCRNVSRWAPAASFSKWIRDDIIRWFRWCRLFVCWPHFHQLADLSSLLWPSPMTWIVAAEFGVSMLWNTGLACRQSTGIVQRSRTCLVSRITTTADYGHSGVKVIHRHIYRLMIIARKSRCMQKVTSAVFQAKGLTSAWQELTWWLLSLIFAQQVGDEKLISWEDRIGPLLFYVCSEWWKHAS